MCAAARRWRNTRAARHRTHEIRVSRYECADRKGCPGAVRDAVIDFADAQKLR
jgi:hypothetical protein